MTDTLHRSTGAPPRAKSITAGIAGPWPRWAAGSLLGLVAVALLIADDTPLGVSTSYRTT